MTSDRPNQTLADYVAIVVSPVLIMGLVGSLVFFLLEVLYPTQGEYKGRLQWILFFFVFGAVLVGRISITQGAAGRARLYGLVLAGLTWIGMQIYVDYPKDAGTAAFAPLINLFLVGVVWWCAHRLTRDCTDVHEEMEVNGEGLLQATGLEKPADDSAKEEKSPGPPLGWWERYRRIREEKKKKRVLGAWVIYFSLAALPLFGLGEALIPAEDAERRQFAFWLMGAYVGCGLGLLLTTCFLGLRRYLRQRRLQMPMAMTAAWLTAGGGLILGLLVVGALLPRPRPEYSLFTLSSAGPDKKSASNFAGKGGSSGQGEGRRIGDQPKDKPDASARDKNGQAAGKDKGQPTPGKDKGSAAGEKDKDGSGKGQDKDKDKGDDSNRPKGNDPPDPNKNKSDSNSQQQQKDRQPPDKKAQQNQQQSSQQSQSQGTSHPGSSWDWSCAAGDCGDGPEMDRLRPPHPGGGVLPDAGRIEVPRSVHRLGAQPAQRACATSGPGCSAEGRGRRRRKARQAVKRSVGRRRGRSPPTTTHSATVRPADGRSRKWCATPSTHCKPGRANTA